MVVVMVSLFYVSILTITVQHEEVHRQIFERYDIESEVTIHYLRPWGVMGTTTPLSTQEYYERCSEFCVLAHNQNEIVGYHLYALLVTIFAASTLVIIVVIFTAEEAAEEVVDELHRDLPPASGF